MPENMPVNKKPRTAGLFFSSTFFIYNNSMRMNHMV